MEKAARGLLYTAKPLTEEEHRAVEEKFAAVTGREVSLTECQCEELLGGIRVELLGRVYDGSVQAQLRHVLAVLQDKEDRHA